MAIVISVINEKGGVGKSTTALCLTSGLTRKGFRTLAIDLDPQRNVTFTMKGENDVVTALDILLGKARAEDAIQNTAEGDLIASETGLAGAERLLPSTGREYKLKEALESIQDKYDYVIIDTPPSLGVLTVNALTASDKALIPAEADTYSLMGVNELSKTIDSVRKYCNPNLKIEGILLTRHNGRTTLSKDLTEVANSIAKNLGTKVFRTPIRQNNSIRLSQNYRKSIFDFAPKSNGAHDYMLVIEEIING